MGRVCLGVTEPEEPGVLVALAGKPRGLLESEAMAGPKLFVPDLLEADDREATAVFEGVRAIGLPTTASIFLGLGLLKSDGRELAVLLGGTATVLLEVFRLGNMPFSVASRLGVLPRG